METVEQYTLIHEKRWTDLLESLAEGEEQSFSFPSVSDIESCVSVAYRINGRKQDRSYSIVVNKEKKMITIRVVTR